MMLLDVNDVLMDPMLTTLFSVRRRAETVNQLGRVVLTEELFEDQLGVITWEDNSRISRLPDGTVAEERLKIVTPFSLRDASFGFQPDIILWNGQEYLITSVKANRHIGRGFTRATATSIRATDNPPIMGSNA